MKWLYLALAGVAVGAIAAWAIGCATGIAWLTDLAPNVLTESIGILVTVAVVDRIIRNREAARRRPRTDAAMEDVTHAFHGLVTAVAGDYIETHRSSEFGELPREIDALLTLWHEGGAENADRVVAADGRTHIARAAALSADTIDRLRSDHRDDLEPAHVVALDDLARDLRNVSLFERFLSDPASPTEKRKQLRNIARLVVEPLEEFWTVYREQPGARRALSDFDMSALVGARIMARHRWSRGQDG